MSELFRTQALAFAYPGATVRAIDGVDLAIAAGTLTAVLGPNGSGKSTLLRLLLGVLRPTSGIVSYAGRPIEAWDRRQLAREVGVVPQAEESVFPVTVRDIVAMGRYPHLGPWRSEGDVDRRAIHDALARCDVLELTDRPFGTLSGGERQRVRIARALAQQPAALVLDEPTAALDVRHEMEILELLFELSRRDAVTVLLVTHHLNLAARYADRLLLLEGGRTAAEGPPAAVLTREIVQRVYEWPVAVGSHPGPGRDAGAPQIVPLSKPNGVVHP